MFLIVFIIHGNAGMETQSYLGYGYLGEYLAGTGYIVVSVNENWCNSYMGTGFTDENDARAVLFLENMKEILGWEGVKNNPLYHKVKKDSIALVGHSRGGEAVSIASVFNHVHNYPDNGLIRNGEDWIFS